MALAYCNDCRSSHVLGDHGTLSSTRRSGGRHLAPKPTRTKSAPRSESTRPVRQVRHVAPADIEIHEPDARRFHLAASMRRFGLAAKSGTTKFLHSWKTWAKQTKRGLVEIVDLQSIKPAVSQPVKHRQSQSRPAPLAREPVSAGVSPARHIAPFGFVERVSGPSQHLLEVSVLESLGFFDRSSVLSVTTDEAPERSRPREMVLTSAAHASSIGASAYNPRSPLPEADILDWKPHVIARSKLGRGRISYTRVIVISVAIVVVAAFVAGLLRAPEREAAAEGLQVADHVAQLALALRRLDPILSDPTTDIAEATPLLIAVDSTARGLFEGASELGDNPEQAVLRQSATSISQRALDLESVLGDSLSYRLVLGPLWRSPELAGQTDPTQAAAGIATWQSLLGDMLETMPTTPELSSHVAQVRAFVEGLESWRIDYMDALAVNDAAGASTEVADLEGQLALIAQSGETTLTDIFFAAGVERNQLLGDLESIAG